MKDLFDFRGTKWFKCDLHIHTPASKCFQDSSVTPKQIVSQALESGLDCIAITDHNTGAMIDDVKKEASGTGLTVFPGVEITCDTSKVHLLVIFDVRFSTSNVNDFLISCGIERSMFTDSMASTIQTIFEIAEKAHTSGGIVIPAHIDEYNGLEKISHNNLNSFYELPFVNAVQIVHKEFTNPALDTKTNEALRTYLNEYYNKPSPAIDYEKIGNWHRPVKLALEHDLALTTFSDNPHEPNNSKHGLAGIGSIFTWLKMDEEPTLEGLRQAFLLPDFRVKNYFTTDQLPYQTPNLWFKSISITNTTITGDDTPLVLEFSPQLTSIIGGRGSGKSSIMRFIRGLFGRTKDLAELHDILKDHMDFYKHHDSRSKNGVLTEKSVIEIEFVRNNLLHKISARDITNSDIQNITIKKYYKDSDVWVEEPAEGYLDFFQYEQYSQKQIYEIAQEPNSLRERIDKSINGLETVKNEREILRKSFLEKSASIRTIKQQISGKGKLETEIKDLEESIDLYKTSGIASLLISKEKFTSQQDSITNFINEVQSYEDVLESLGRTINLVDINYGIFDSGYSSELKPYSNNVIDTYNTLKIELVALNKKAEEARNAFETNIVSSIWKKDYEQNQTDLISKKEELEKKGIDDISIFEKLSDTKSTKDHELKTLLEIETQLAKELANRKRLHIEYHLKTKDITEARKSYVDSHLQDDKVKVSINPLKNKTDFENKLRTILQRPTGFDSDIDKLISLCFTGDPEKKIIAVRNVFIHIRKGEPTDLISGYFIKLVKNMSEAQIDEIELLLPEDEIKINYKPSGSPTYRSLTTASAGQKTTAILTLILSQGDTPLLLDQPEDDLDNRLVYELIVDRLKQAKEVRQIIVVTHNANIPVNGDAEYIVSMNSESKNLAVFYSGTVEQTEIKKEICDVMEGSEQAFDMRSKRYKQIT